MTILTPTLDTRGRPLRDLRISVTDRCNFRCLYCMPKEVFGPGFEFLSRNEILSFEEIARLAGITRGLGVRKVRLTGGEPLVRKELPKLIERLAVFGDLDLALTTNGSLLKKQAPALAAAGLRRVTVSLDSLDDEVFRRMNDVDFPVARVLEGIDAAAAAGLAPIKINAVVHRGVNDHTLVDLARHFKERGHTLRLIEFMDVGNTNGWSLEEVVPGAEMVRRIGAEMPLEPVEAAYRGEVAKRWRYRDGGDRNGVEVGVVTSVTLPFCGDCTRARISAEGKLYTCLFATDGVDLRAVLRDGSSDREIADLLAGVWGKRADRYSELRLRATDCLPVARKIEMSYIGG